MPSPIQTSGSAQLSCAFMPAAWAARPCSMPLMLKENQNTAAMYAPMMRFLPSALRVILLEIHARSAPSSTDSAVSSSGSASTASSVRSQKPTVRPAVP